MSAAAPLWNIFQCESLSYLKLLKLCSSSTNSETGKVTTDKIAFHGCEKDLAEAFANNVNVVCSEHTNACYNYTREEISDDLVTQAEACFCDGDR